MLRLVLKKGLVCPTVCGVKANLVIRAAAGLARWHAGSQLAAFRRGLPRAAEVQERVRTLAAQLTNLFSVLLYASAALCFVAERMQPGEHMAVLGWALAGVALLNAAFMPERRNRSSTQRYIALPTPRPWADGSTALLLISPHPGCGEFSIQVTNPTTRPSSSATRVSSGWLRHHC